jgi:hypothetical protein
MLYLIQMMFYITAWQITWRRISKFVLFTKYYWDDEGRAAGNCRVTQMLVDWLIKCTLKYVGNLLLAEFIKKMVGTWSSMFSARLSVLWCRSTIWLAHLNLNITFICWSLLRIMYQRYTWGPSTQQLIITHLLNSSYLFSRFSRA